MAKVVSTDLYDFDLSVICCVMKWSRANHSFPCFNVCPPVKEDLRGLPVSRHGEDCVDGPL